MVNIAIDARLVFGRSTTERRSQQGSLRPPLTTLRELAVPLAVIRVGSQMRVARAAVHSMTCH
jgi:hypothetical protein